MRDEVSRRVRQPIFAAVSMCLRRVIVIIPDICGQKTTGNVGNEVVMEPLVNFAFR
jgi:hypothetical protein